jgi:hypothetical protein
MALFLAGMPCPPYDRLRTITVPDVFQVEEAAFERWRYQMRNLVRALCSDTMKDASKVRFVQSHHFQTLLSVPLVSRSQINVIAAGLANRIQGLAKRRDAVRQADE